MESLQVLLIKNQTNLDRLRARVSYYTALLALNGIDTHKQYGPYADFWDEWYQETQVMLRDVRSDMIATEGFVSELKSFLKHLEKKPRSRTSKVLIVRLAEMNELAKEALLCQHDMIHMADERIQEHREFTKRLLLVEAMEGLSED